MVLSQRSVTVRHLPLCMLLTGCSASFYKGFVAGSMLTAVTFFIVAWFSVDKSDWRR